MAQAPDGGATIDLYLWRDDSAFGEYYGEDNGLYYNLIVTSNMLQEPESRQGYTFIGWKVNNPLSPNYTNPTGILSEGDIIYSIYHDFYLTSIWEKETHKKSRIQFKSDTETNWSAIEENFQSLKGEFYFYNNALDTGKKNHAGQTIFKPRLKIGDGDHKLAELNFFSEEYITNSQIDQLFGSKSNILGTAQLGSLILG